MARNASLDRFKKLVDELKQECLDTAVEELNRQSDNLVETMESVAPVFEGALVHTIKKVTTNKPTMVRIVAGGRETVRENVSTKPYDYARADEFGTVNMPAQPFFFPTYRLMKKKMRSAVKRKLTAAIKKRSAE